MKLSSIQEDHENEGRLYPRPTIKCDICSEDLIVCWGKEIDLYVRHKSNSKTNHKPVAESFEHKYAKKLLIDYLNNGGICIFNHTCGLKQIVPANLIFKDEVVYKDSRLDICGFDKINEKIICNIEIFHTSKTKNVQDRNELIFFEIKAMDVCNSLDKSTSPKVIYFNDISVKKCLKCNESNKILNDLNRINFAIQLGYLNFDNVPKFELYRRMAMEGCIKYYWSDQWSSNKTDLKVIWNEFLKYKTCLFCGLKSETSYYKPYCKKCFIRIKTTDISSAPEIYKKEISQTVKSDLRSQMSWLKYIKNFNNESCLCDICNTTKIFSKKNCVWWFGEYKAICSQCINMRLTKDGLYQQYDTILL